LRVWADKTYRTAHVHKGGERITEYARKAIGKYRNHIPIRNGEVRPSATNKTANAYFKYLKIRLRGASASRAAEKMGIGANRRRPAAAQQTT
jgi:hypothetical protein